MQSFDVKDAFLTVRQRDELYVLLDGVPYRVHYCLPGQQPAAAWWAEQLTEDLKESGLVPDAACPAEFGKPGMGSTVHVDDGLMAGEADTMEHVASILKSKYKLELSDVACDVGDVVKFLKKELVITDMGARALQEENGGEHDLIESAIYVQHIVQTLSSAPCRYGFLMVRLGYKGFNTTSRDQVKLDRLHGKVLRLLVLMDAMKGVTAYEVVMVNEYEPNTSGSFSLEGMRLHIESVLSFYLPTWFLLLMVMVGVCFVAWIIREIGASRDHGREGGGYGLDGDVRDSGDDHECEDQGQSDGESNVSEQCDEDVMGKCIVNLDVDACERRPELSPTQLIIISGFTWLHAVNADLMYYLDRTPE
ncbi:GIP [Symbiodinium pilosum]|uniref:GIP protein n=1 Tax=Symbiodinium pilosum TaxID=2952 RepID=A0A812S4E2_SYMPI|nr:GIP [Symbiodinium pilosum]